MIIYRILNKINNKSYIGQSVLTFNKRYKGGQWWKYTHNLILKNSIDKYGLDNFDFEIIEDNVKDINELNKLEVLYAEKFNSYRPNGYNIRGCGDNKFVDDELKKHLSTFRLGTNYSPTNKKTRYKGVYWKESKKSWLCRFYNTIIKKDKYVDSELEAVEMYDKVSLYLFGKFCYINFEEKRKEYLESDLEWFYNNVFLKEKTKRKDGYFKDDSELLELIRPLIWKMSIPNIAKKLDTTIRKINWCIKKNNLESPGKNYWQKIRKSTES
jgi:group I intron endonuclease